MQATSLYQPVQERLDGVIDGLKEMANQRFPLLSELLDHVFSAPGKRMRPAITLLASNFNPHDETLTETMATAVEMLHIATLIHDDTVDDSAMRRGRATVSNLWGDSAAVLVGDYIFAASATLVCDTGNIRVIKRFAETIMELSSGELREMAESYNSRQTREQYFERIYEKTASLFTTAGETGAVLSGAPEEFVEALKSYSCNLGMAFQIVDDILDFDGTEQEVGKPVGHDLLEGTLTLPGMLLLERFPEDNPIVNMFQGKDVEGNRQRALEMARASGVIDDAYGMARQFTDVAADAIRDLPDTRERQSLLELTSYVIERRR